MSVSRAWRESYEADAAEMQRGWRAILGPRFTFPRELLVRIPGPDGKRYNEEPRTMQQYLRLVERYAPRRDLWVSWSNSQDYDAQSMTWLVGDVDSDADLQEALDRARRYEEFCITTFGVQPASLFTCKKGFHLHFTHDEVPYRGKPYADAVMYLTDKSRAYLDAGPLKSRHAKPRVPYSINLEASGKARHPMFVVPVDLTWSLKEIQQASRECQVNRFKVPHSRSAADILTPLAHKVDERLKEMRAKRKDTGADRERIQAAISFCEENGPRMVNTAGRPDGRKRLMFSVYLPALMHLHKGNEDQVLTKAQAWAERCGAPWRSYAPVAESTLKRCVLDDGSLRMPMGIPRWLAENPGLRFPEE